VTTQFVVGAADEPDIEILKTANFLYKKVGISRSYFSAFIPITDTPLSSKKPTPWLREFRLYQADFLLRNYNFKPEELTTCNLDLRLDPKLNWAMNNPQNFPVEINKAEEFQLLRIPGIGPETAKRIISHRIKNRFHNLQELRSIGVIIKRAVNFITINGKSYRQFI
jgi:predicted DNA-binding helix-hairpin-helix protein